MRTQRKLDAKAGPVPKRASFLTKLDWNRAQKNLEIQGFGNGASWDG